MSYCRPQNSSNDLRDLKSLVSEFSNFIPKYDNRLICPVESLKRGYGLIKCHRLNNPVRPIISGLNSLTSGCETYLLNLVKPILSECNFVINSTREFNKKFCKIKEKFDAEKYEIASFDASSLFTSINVKRTINFIIRKIYANANKFFPITPETPKPPPKLLLRTFFTDVLLKYNAFETLGGFYRQKSGVSMGGKLSCAMTNIFVHILEEQIIQKYIKKRVILSYMRYVDDCFLVVKKGHKAKILREMNNFDKNLNWTMENMENNKLIYLDTQVVLEDSEINLYQYRKPNNSQVLINYKYGISPKCYKTGLISGEVFRAKNCTSSEKALDEALVNLENIFVKNLYPRKIVKQKIREIRGRDFGPNPNKEKQASEKNNSNIKHVTISMAYTSFRCSVIASNIHKIIKKYTPNFKLRIAFSTIKLSSVILPTLKPRIPELYTTNLVYRFTCDCSSTYIGHTKKYFEKRILQHRTDSKSHINKHIANCHLYQENISENYGIEPNGAAKREYIKSHFSILEKNLYNYHSRVTYEGLMITLHNPDLNKQVYHKSMTFVCECANFKIENTVGT